MTTPAERERAEEKVPRPVGGTVATPQEIAQRLVSSLWNTRSTYEDYVAAIATLIRDMTEAARREERERTIQSLIDELNQPHFVLHTVPDGDISYMAIYTWLKAVLDKEA